MGPCGKLSSSFFGQKLSSCLTQHGKTEELFRNAVGPEAFVCFYRKNVEREFDSIDKQGDFIVFISFSCVKKNKKEKGKIH